jgi:hypothetical protein
MEFPDALPAFDEDWISQSRAIITAHGGTPPHINFSRGDYAVEPETILVDEEIEEAIFKHVRDCGSDLPSRFAALNYLWVARLAISASCEEDDDDSGGRDHRREAWRALRQLVDRLDPESVSTPEQAVWEFKQAFILQNWDRLKSLGLRRRTLEGTSPDDLNLLMGGLSGSQTANIGQVLSVSLPAWRRATRPGRPCSMEIH